MAITFGGLATGLDTNSIVSELMALERRPLNRMEADKTWLNDRLSAYTEFDSKLKLFLENIGDLDSSNDVRRSTANVADPSFFTATAGTNSVVGTNYQIEVINLAQVQKSVSTGFVDRGLDQFGSGNLSITVDGVPQNISIAAGDGSLGGIMSAINDADIGVSASIINDGTASPYRLVLTGRDAATGFSIDTSGLSNGNLLNPGTDPIIVTQTATRAHIQVDNIDIYSDNNNLTEAIPGVTLNLLRAEPGTRTTIDIRLDEDTIKEKIQAFVTGYNDAVAFVTGQSVINGSSGGVLSGDSGLSSVKRHMQDMLTTRVNNSGTFNYLSQLGFETQKDGSLTINDSVLTAAIQDNFDDVEALLVGETGNPGIASQFNDYLQSITNSSDGLLAGRKQSIDSNLRRIDNRIGQMEMRLEHKEETMRARFVALESLISGMNAQSSFLTQQMNMLSNITTGKS